VLFGAPRLLRFLTISGKEFLPSQGTFRPIVPELITLGALLAHLQLTREQLVDLAILVGTDFNNGVKGIGPKRALGLLQRHGRIERMPGDIREAVGELDVIEDIRRIYLSPDVTDEYDVAAGEPNRSGITDFLCGEHDFAKDRVTAALDRAFPKPTLF
jgi:flap endonuclease-1